MRLLKWFQELALPVRILLGTLMAMIGGPGLIAVLSEYATYLYALHLGIRPPLEGIPYLAATAALASVIIALCAFLVFLFARLMFATLGTMSADVVRTALAIVDEGLAEYRKKGGRFFKRVNTAEFLEWLRRRPFFQVLIAVVIVSVLLFAFLSDLESKQSPNDGKALALFISIYTSSALFTLWRAWFAWVVGVLAALVFYVSSWQVLFNFDNHENFLRVIGYGGGVPVRVVYSDGESIGLFLALRTTSALIGRTSVQEEWIEIPLGRVKRLVYLQAHADEEKSKRQAP